MSESHLDPRPRVLFVDDEEDLLAAVVRSLRKYPFDITTASRAAIALERLKDSGPFSAIISDLRMPGMDGVALLGQARQLSPDTVRILFTGQPDLDHAISAVNQGAIFRFITKPCSPILLATVLEAAVEQHRLITSERVLLEQTLHGSIQALSEILGLSSPMAFGRGTRIRHLAGLLASEIRVREKWQVEVAAMLSQIGYVILDPATLERVYKGQDLTVEESETMSRLPSVVEQILANIPRIEGVREILKYDQRNFDGSGPPAEERRLKGQEIPIGARILHLVLAFDVLERQGVPAELGCNTLRGRSGLYDPALVEILTRTQGGIDRYRVRELPLMDVRPGMRLAQDVYTDRGLLVVASGQEVTPRLLERLQNFSKRLASGEALRVTVPEPSA